MATDQTTPELEPTTKSNSTQLLRRLQFLFIGLGVLFFAGAGYLIWRTQFAQPAGAEITNTLPAGSKAAALRIHVNQTGITAIPMRQIQQAELGIDTISPETIALSRDGQSVPFYVAGEGRNATLYFYAEAAPSDVLPDVVYWLEAGTGEAVEMVDNEVGEATTTGRLRAHYENNDIFNALAISGDLWFGYRLNAAITELDIPLTNIDSNGGEAELTLRIWSNNEDVNVEPDHHLIIQLNGTEVADYTWDGKSLEIINIPIEAGILQAENNVVTIQLPLDTGAAGEDLYLDSVTLDYESDLALGDGQLQFMATGSASRVNGANNEEALVFDVTEPAGVVQLNAQMAGDMMVVGTETGRSYILFTPDQAHQPAKLTIAPQWETPLRSAQREADYVAIVADVPEFMDDLQPLLDLRQSQGLAVTTTTIQQVYDEFGYGRETPEAIRDFITYAVDEWSVPPTYIMLVGDASYDIHNRNESLNQNLLPTQLIYTEFAGWVASDTWFTLPTDDTLAPIAAIGRLPVQNSDQLQTLVQKILDYERNEATDWLGRALLVADDEPYFDTTTADLAGNLDSAGYDTIELYMSQDEDIHETIITSINDGVGIVNYVGHGGIRVWGDELVLQTEDVDQFLNGSQLPIFTTFTCLNGYFNHPDVDALAEAMLWTEKGGVVASIAPSGRSLTNQQLPIATTFFELLLSGEKETLGEALQIAKIDSSENDFLNDVIHTFNLLGDPALKFRLP